MAGAQRGRVGGTLTGCIAWLDAHFNIQGILVIEPAMLDLSFARRYDNHTWAYPGRLIQSKF